MPREHKNSERSPKTDIPDVSRVIDRPELVARLASARTVWINAPAGSGKSTLLAKYAHARNGAKVWYRIDELDSDLARFVATLAAAIEARLAMGPGRLPRLGRGPQPVPSGFGRLFAQAALAATDTSLLFVFDDFHRLPDDCAAAAFVSALIEELHGPHQLAVASRQPPVASLARSFVHGDAVELRAMDLAMSSEEVARLAAALGVRRPSVAEADAIAQRTRGWAAGVRVILAAGGPWLEPRSLPQPGPAERLADYFEHEVLSHLPEQSRALLERVSVASQVPAELAVELIGDKEAPQVLEDLAKKQLFVTASGTTQRVFELHALLREHLFSRLLQRLRKDEIRLLQRRAADVSRALGLTSEAVSLYASAGCGDAIRTIVLEEAPRLVQAGQLVTLESWLAHLEPARIEADPWLLLWRAACRVGRSPTLALSEFERAYRIFKDRAEWTGAISAWSGAVEAIFLEYGDLSKFDPWLAEYDEALEANANDAAPWAARLALVWLFTAYAFRAPGHPRMPALRAKAKELVASEPDPTACALLSIYLAAHAIWIGDLGEAAMIVRDLDKLCARVPFNAQVRIEHALIRETLAVFCGEQELATAAIEEGLREAERTGLHVWDPVFLLHATTLAIARDDRKAALNWLRRLRSVVPMSGPHQRAYYHLLAAWLAADAGDYPGAHAHLREALASQAASGDFFAGCNCVAGVLTLLRLGDEPEQVAALLNMLDTQANKTGNPMLAWMAGMLRGYWLIERGDEQQGRDLLTAALSIGKTHDYLHFLIFPPAVISRVAHAALEREIEVSYVRRLITHNSFRPPSDRPRLELWPWPVRIYTFGRFGILRNGQKIEFERKAQRAPLRLLQATIAFGGRQVAESQLIDALWPDSEGDAAASALTAAVHRLRQLIGDESLRRQEGRLSVDSQLVWVDAWALEQLLAGARRGQTAPMTATEFAQRLRHLYQGDFLHGERDAAWALTYREKLHAETVSALTSRMTAAIDQGDWAGVDALSEVGLHIDECVEAFHRAAIQAHLARNDANAAVLAYRRCHRTLSLRLMAAPSAATVELFHRARALADGAANHSKE